jgi:hypothetical protein
MLGFKDGTPKSQAQTEQRINDYSSSRANLHRLHGLVHVLYGQPKTLSEKITKHQRQRHIVAHHF